MNAAAQIFRTYFDNEEDRLDFYLKHRVETVDKPGTGSGVSVRGGATYPTSHDDKPAFIGVFEAGDVAIEISWWNGKDMHRDDGPARIVTDRNGKTDYYWYKDGNAISTPK